MKPILWGSGMWHIVFTAAWHCNADKFPLLLEMIQLHLPTLIPCEKCKKHYLKHCPVVRRRAQGDPRDAIHAFRWLYFLKDEVNKTLAIRSTSLTDLTERYLLYKGRVDEVLIADTLVCIAISAEKTGDDDIFLQFCNHMLHLLPFAYDSELEKGLRVLRKPVVTHTMRIYVNTRKEHGLPHSTLLFFKKLLE